MARIKMSIAPDTIFRFPTEMVVRQCGSEVIIVSPKDGNWIVISEGQFQILEELKSGRNVGDVVSSSVDMNETTSLLKQLLARKFTEKDLSVADNGEKVLFYLTYDCNLTCDHCYMYGQRRKGDLLSVNEYSSIFTRLKLSGVKEVTFSGGEPLIRKDFWEIIKQAHENGLAPQVFSNGTLWADSDIEKAKRFSIKAQISIDGIDEISSALVRGEGVFEKAKNTVIRLAKAGVDVEVATTPLMCNIEKIEEGYSEFVAEIREKTGGNVCFKVSFDLMPGRNVPSMTLEDQQEYYKRAVRIYSIANPNGIKIPFFDEYIKGLGREVCGLGKLVFSPDGFVHVCGRLDYLQSIGNVREIDVDFLIERARKYVAAVSVDNTIPCKDCYIRHICGGGCRGVRYEYVSDSLENYSVHKPCSEEYKKALLKKMVQATKECYKWG